MKKTYIQPETKKLRIYFEHALLNPSLYITNNTEQRATQWSQKKDNGADIWSGNISWGYDADE